MNRASRIALSLVGIGIGALISGLVSKQARLRFQPDYFFDQVVLITGASRGLGRAMAHAFTERGAHIVLAARSADQLEKVASECRTIRADAQALIVPTDVTDDAQLERLTEKALERFGCIDILVNNAGIMQGGALYEISGEAIRQHFDVNVLATIRLTQMVLPHMLDRGEGHIVTMASHAGQISLPYFAAYSATKHALIGFAESLRRELKGTKIRTTILKPGFAETDFVSDSLAAWRYMGLPVITPEQVAQRALNAIQLGEIVVNMGIYETFGGWVNEVSPTLVDLWWRVLAPRNLKQIAERQKTK